MTITAWIVIGVLVVLFLLWFWRHQRMLEERARLMQEAIRNHDLTFRLPTRHMFRGERALQESLHHPAVKDSDLEEGINAIHNTVVHLNSFVDGYRKYSQLQKPVPKAVDLVAAVSDVVQLFPDVEWQNQLSGEVIIKTDPNLLRQILINLIKNAIEAGAKTLGVECEMGPEGRVLLYISNDGELIPAEARASIFIPFFTTKRKGNGIGLSLSRRLLTIQGGMMSLLDEPRYGFRTTFLLEFPK